MKLKKLKIFNKANTEDISYEIISRQKVHTCEVKKIKKVKNTECMNIDELKIWQKISLNYIDKDMNIGINTFYKNNIFWKKGKIRKFVDNIIQEKYQKDKLFILNIVNTNIKFNEIEYNLCLFK